MKDYLLSEIKDHDGFEDWETEDDVTGYSKNALLNEIRQRLKNIDAAFTPRDVVELPCKCRTEVMQYNNDVFGVLYRDFATNRILIQAFVTEEGADNFLEIQRKLAKRRSIDFDELQKVTDTWNALAAKHRRGEHLTDAEVDEMLAAWDRKVELEKKGDLYHASK